MKNVIIKQKKYKDYGMFQHIYVVDVNYDFNDKTIDELTEYVESDPFLPIMIHADDITLEMVDFFGKINSNKEIWFKTKGFLFEDFSTFTDETIVTLNLAKIDYIVDALGDEIDFKESIVFNELIKYEHIECPF